MLLRSQDQFIVSIEEPNSNDWLQAFYFPARCAEHGERREKNPFKW